MEQWWGLSHWGRDKVKIQSSKENPSLKREPHPPEILNCTKFLVRKFENINTFRWVKKAICIKAENYPCVEQETLPVSHIFKKGSVEGSKQQASSISKISPYDFPTYGSKQYPHSSASTKVTLIVLLRRLVTCYQRIETYRFGKLFGFLIIKTKGSHDLVTCWIFFRPNSKKHMSSRYLPTFTRISNLRYAVNIPTASIFT